MYSRLQSIARLNERTRLAACEYLNKREETLRISSRLVFRFRRGFSLFELDEHELSGLSLRFLGKWFSGGITMDCPAFQLRSSVLPSGNVNLPWFSVRKTATVAGCPCMEDFSRGP